MIELYVVISLLGIGYILNQNKQFMQQNQTPLKTVPKLKETPSAKTPYSSIYTDHVRKEEAKKCYNAYVDPKRVSRNAHLMRNNMIQSQLTGTLVEATHNNMTPFFGRTTAPMKSNSTLMETFGVVRDPFAPKKQEQEPLFVPSKDVGNVNGTKIITDLYQNRIVKPIIQNNVLPFTQVKVGPGLNKGFTSQPTGGFQQADTRDYVLPKDTNELRVKCKPKVTFEGRVVDGQKEIKLGKHGEMKKNRVETFYENNPDRYFVTTGAYVKEKQRAEVPVKPTSRAETGINTYEGPAYRKIAFQTRSEIKDPLKSQLAGFDVSNPTLVHTGKGAADDYGKASIPVYANERDITTQRAQVGNLTSLIKAITAPLEDALKTTKKEYAVDAERQFGNMSIQIPKKQTVHDPNDVMRTTIKETTLHDSDTLNLKGHTKVIVYDPDSVARTTIKETTLHDADNLNLKANVFKSVAYDPSSVAKTTVKETTIHDSDRLNIARVRKASTVYDPNDVARTTIKETTIHDTDLLNVKVANPYGIVYDDDEEARPTNRQTLDDIDYNANLVSSRRAATVYNPDSIAKTTIRETTLSDDRTGNIDRKTIQVGGYDEDIFDAKTTQKETYADTDYFGGAKQDKGEGYIVANVEAKTTQKETYADNEYFGGANDQSTHKPMSYEDAYNACIDSLKESTLVRREPTQTSVKVVQGSDHINMQTRKIECDSIAERETMNSNRVINHLAHIDVDSITRQRNDYDLDDRLDEDLLKAFKENPYTKSLDSFA